MHSSSSTVRRICTYRQNNQDPDLSNAQTFRNCKSQSGAQHGTPSQPTPSELPSPVIACHDKENLRNSKEDMRTVALQGPSSRNTKCLATTPKGLVELKGRRGWQPVTMQDKEGAAVSSAVNHLLHNRYISKPQCLIPASLSPRSPRKAFLPASLISARCLVRAQRRNHIIPQRHCTHRGNLLGNPTEACTRPCPGIHNHSILMDTRYPPTIPLVLHAACTRPPFCHNQCTQHRHHAHHVMHTCTQHRSAALSRFHTGPPLSPTHPPLLGAHSWSEALPGSAHGSLDAFLLEQRYVSSTFAHSSVPLLGVRQADMKAGLPQHCVLSTFERWQQPGPDQWAGNTSQLGDSPEIRSQSFVMVTRDVYDVGPTPRLPEFPKWSL